MIPYLDLHTINAPYEADIKQALLDVVDSGWYLFGQQVSTFEQEWADYNGARHCVACANGLDALRLVLRSWIEMEYLKRGDGVIVPANTYIASILAVSDNGLVPIPVEPDPESYLIDPRTIAQLLEDPKSSPAYPVAKDVAIRAILPVHLYGQRCDMEAIDELAARYHRLGRCRCGDHRRRNVGYCDSSVGVLWQREEVCASLQRRQFSNGRTAGCRASHQVA